MATSDLAELSNRAREAVVAGNYKEGRALYTQAIAISPDSADAHYGLATCCFLLNDLDAALDHFREVTRLDPLRATAFINLGALYNRLGQQDESITHIRKGLQLDPRRSEGYYNLGIAYRQKGMSDLAIQAYREATRLNPRFADAYLNLGNVMLEAERYHEAIGAYQQAIAVRPNFEKAVQGLRNAEQALAAVQARSSAETAEHAETTDAGEAEPAPGFVNVVERAEAIDVLREAAAKHEEACREIVRVMEQDLGAALRDLSRSLVGTPAAGELELHVKAYASSVENVRLARKNMDAGMEKIRQLGKRFAAASHAAGEPVS